MALRSASGTPGKCSRNLSSPLNLSCVGQRRGSPCSISASSPLSLELYRELLAEEALDLRAEEALDECREAYSAAIPSRSIGGIDILPVFYAKGPNLVTICGG